MEEMTKQADTAYACPAYWKGLSSKQESPFQQARKPFPANKKALSNGTITDSCASSSFPLAYQEAAAPFIRLDSLTLKAFRQWRATLPGFDGVPVPYSPRTDHVVGCILLGYFFLCSVVLFRGKRFLAQQLKDTVTHRERTNLFDSSTASDIRYLLILVTQTCALAAISLFTYFQDLHPALPAQAPSWLLLGSYMAFLLAYLAAKWLSYLLIGWIFFDKSVTQSWISSYFTLIYYLGFALFPVVLLTVYQDLDHQYVVWIGLSLLVLIKLLMFYKWIKLFLDGISAIFLLILYFCALEIVPCILVYQGLTEINYLLTIKI